MHSKRNKKLCWNCDGEIDKDAVSCLFCGSEMYTEPSKEKIKAPPAPPYTPKKKIEKVEKEELQTSQAVSELQPINSFSTLGFIVLLIGAVLLAFAFFLLIFENNGTLILSWNAHFWFVYLLFSLPLLLLGSKMLK